MTSFFNAVEDQEKPSKNKKSKPSQGEVDFFDSIDSDEEAPPEQPGMLDDLMLRGRRYGARIKETALGLPGDVIQTARDLVKDLPGAIKEEDDLNFAQRLAKQGLEQFPGSAEYRAESAEKQPELEPVTEFQELEDEFFTDATEIALTGGTKNVAKAAMRAVGISAFGNLSKEAVKRMGAGETGQNATKLGTMIFGGLFGKGRGVKNLIKKSYQKARSFVPTEAEFAYPMKPILNLEKELLKGSMNNSKEPAMKLINDIKEKVVNGMMSVEEAMQFDIDISDALGKVGSNKKLDRYLKMLNKSHGEGMDVYGKQNAAWAEHYKEAKMAFAGIAQSEDIKKFFRKNANLKNLTYGAALLGIEEASLPGHAAIKVGSLAATGVAYLAKEVGKRIVKNPALRKYYQNVLTASLSENKSMLARSLAGFERAAKKEFENEPIPDEILEFLEKDSDDQ